MKIKIDNVNLFLYGICVFLLTFSQSEFLQIAGGMKRIAIIIEISCIVFSILINFNRMLKLNKITFVLYLIFSFVIFWGIIFLKGDMNLIFIVVYMLLCCGIQPKKVVRTYFWAVLCTIIITLVLWSLGLTSNTIVLDRYYLGFIYTTFGANLFLHCCIALVASSKKRLSIYVWIIIMIANYWFYIKTQTSAAFILCICLCVCDLLFNFKKCPLFRTKIINWVLSYFSFIITGFTIGFQMFYNKFCNKFNFLSELNAILSGRLRLGKMAFEQYHITLFGQNMAWDNTIESMEYFYIDSSYVQVLLEKGIIMLLILCIIMTIITKYFIKIKDRNMVIGIVILLMHCITDPQLLSFRYNPFLIIFLTAAYGLYYKKNNTKSEFNINEIKT